MNASIRAAKNKRRKVGRPRTTGTGEQVTVRMHEPMLGMIRAWAAEQDGKPTRPEAIRRLIERGLANEANTAQPRRPVKKHNT